MKNLKCISYVNQILQIMAIVAAGMWTFTIWNTQESDKRDLGLNVNYEIKKERLDYTDACSYEVFTNTINNSQKTIEVASNQYEIKKAKLYIMDKDIKYRIGSFLEDEYKSLHTGSIETEKWLIPPKGSRKMGFIFQAKPDNSHGYRLSFYLFDKNDKGIGEGFEVSLSPCLKTQL